MSAAELAGGFGGPGSLMQSGIEEAFQRRRLAPLPVQTRRLLQLAAVGILAAAPILTGAKTRVFEGRDRRSGARSYAHSRHHDAKKV